MRSDTWRLLHSLTHLPPNTAPSHSQLEENAHRVERGRIAGTFAQQEEPFTEVLQGVCVCVSMCVWERETERERGFGKASRFLRGNKPVSWSRICHVHVAHSGRVRGTTGILPP